MRGDQPVPAECGRLRVTAYMAPWRANACNLLTRMKLKFHMAGRKSARLPRAPSMARPTRRGPLRCRPNPRTQPLAHVCHCAVKGVDLPVGAIPTRQLRSRWQQWEQLMMNATEPGASRWRTDTIRTGPPIRGVDLPLNRRLVRRRLGRVELLVQREHPRDKFRPATVRERPTRSYQGRDLVPHIRTDTPPLVPRPSRDNVCCRAAPRLSFQVPANLP